MNHVSIILAAGKGTRMKSDLPKVLHHVYGVPMIHHVCSLAQLGINSSKTIVVVGHKAELVRKSLKECQNIEFVEQKELLGTGHAILQCQENLRDYHGPVVVLSGDTPFLTKETVNKLLEAYWEKDGVGVVFLTAEVPDPTGLGRIIREPISNQVIKIVEEKDATAEERLIREVNTGTYVFDSDELFRILPTLGNDNKQGEYYLTDVIHLTKKDVIGVLAKDYRETLGINTQEQLREGEELFR